MKVTNNQTEGINFLDAPGGREIFVLFHQYQQQFPNKVKFHLQQFKLIVWD